MPNTTNTNLAAGKWEDSDLQIHNAAGDGSLEPTGEYVTDHKVLEHNQLALREREVELDNWRANLAMYEYSIPKMRDSANGWRAQAHALAPRLETPRQRWAWAIGGVIAGLVFGPMFFRSRPPKPTTRRA